ncbi:uncharacterized protein LTR77_002288 [Saxophila tyrrhenica]|uniref:Beta-lactamase-related domain-containing protein n=1 Tax=Saxophila tyrrhenica TaxID=1690608 RepID=A0AAV9PKU2_9PEZI|nr:hypothetical protein LTR77_002288 [Saxophila tyrrhenica]
MHRSRTPHPRRAHSRILPELASRPILESFSDSGPVYRPSTTPITARHLLTHTSGLGYYFLHPLLTKWANHAQRPPTNLVVEKYNYPLLFEPGEGWQYGCGLDWAGVAVARISGMNLEDYMIERIWKPVGRSAPFPTFHLSRHSEYKARLLQMVKRSNTGRLEPAELPVGDNPDDEEGGAGLTMTMRDFTAVLADLVSGDPKLLTPATISMAFEPQIPSSSPAIPMLKQLRPAWDMVSGPVPSESVNHGLLGLLLQGEAPEIKQPAGLMVWGGAANVLWFVGREEGVAGCFATQVLPLGEQRVKELANAWRRDFWGGWREGRA